MGKKLSLLTTVLQERAPLPKWTVVPTNLPSALAVVTATTPPVLVSVTLATLWKPARNKLFWFKKEHAKKNKNIDTISKLAIYKKKKKNDQPTPYFKMFGINSKIKKYKKNNNTVIFTQ